MVDNISHRSFYYSLSSSIRDRIENIVGDKNLLLSILNDTQLQATTIPMQYIFNVIAPYQNDIRARYILTNPRKGFNAEMGLEFIWIVYDYINQAIKEKILPEELELMLITHVIQFEKSSPMVENALDGLDVLTDFLNKFPAPNKINDGDNPMDLFSPN